MNKEFDIRAAELRDRDIEIISKAVEEDESLISFMAAFVKAEREVQGEIMRILTRYYISEE